MTCNCNQFVPFIVAEHMKTLTGEQASGLIPWIFPVCNDCPEFQIEVQVTHTRTYHIAGVDAHDALARWQADQFYEGDFTESYWYEDNRQEPPWEAPISYTEKLDTAEVYSTDGLHTLLATADGDL